MRGSAKNYVVAAVGPWHREMHRRHAAVWPGRWTLIEDPRDLTVGALRALRPRKVFVPHWHWRVPATILRRFECIGFHETALPYGRGGSPIQNLILRGFDRTVISAYRMNGSLDAGPVLLQRPLSLRGRAEVIYRRCAASVWRMMKSIVENNPAPVEQAGRPVVFRRRTPRQSRLPRRGRTLVELYDFIRMLDAQGYPAAFLEYGSFVLRLREARRTNRGLEAKVLLTRKEPG